MATAQKTQKPALSGRFKDIGKAKVSQGGVYFLPGVYLVKIRKVSAITTRKKDDMFIVECEILESNNPERSAGVRPSWCVNLSQDAALGNIKGFIAAANGIDPSNEEQVDEEVDEETVEYACSDDNPLEGVTLRLTATNILTREKKDFTLHKWEPVEEAA